MRTKYLVIQFFATLLFIFSLIINMILVYNQILVNEYGVELIKKEDIPLIVRINKFIVLILLFVFLYINYKNYQLDLYEKKDTKQDNYELLASLLTFISGCIILYSVVKFSDISLENPTS